MTKRVLVLTSLLSLASPAGATPFYTERLDVVDADCTSTSRRMDPREGTTVYFVAYTSKYSSARLANGEVFTGPDEFQGYAEVDQIQVEDAAGEPVAVSVTTADVCPENGRRFALTLPKSEGRYRLRFGSAVDEVLVTTEPAPPAPEVHVEPPSATPKIEATPPAEGSPAPSTGTPSSRGTSRCQTAAPSGSVLGLLFVSLVGLGRRRW